MSLIFTSVFIAMIISSVVLFFTSVSVAIFTALGVTAVCMMIGAMLRFCDHVGEY